MKGQLLPLFQDYRGRDVRLTDERRAHVLAHPEMVDMEAALAETLSGPLRVMQSASDPMVELSYRRYPATRLGEKYLCVVVKVLPGDAFVITAYLTDQIKRGTLLWPSER